MCSYSAKTVRIGDERVFDEVAHEEWRNRITPMRVRVTISKRAIDCLDFLYATIPLVFRIDRVYIKNRPDTVRFAIRWLTALANATGIGPRVNRRDKRYFRQRLVQANKPNDVLDLTPEKNYRAPDASEKNNLTFETATDDSFRQLKAIYALEGVRNNNHLVEEIVFSMSACVMAYAAGYTVKGVNACQILEGFGEVCVDVDDALIEMMNAKDHPSLAPVVDLRKR